MIFTTALALAAAPLHVAKPAEFVSALQDAGFRAELDVDDVGDPMIKSSANGASFIILFYGCEENKNCTDLQFYAGYTLDEPVGVDVVNAFNQEYRFTRAYIDPDNDPVIEMDVLGGDGKIDDEQFKRALDIWTDLMGAYQAAIDF